MQFKLKRSFIAGAVAALGVAGTGAALAATQLGSPKEESQAVIDDAAQQLGIDSAKLSAALTKALQNRVDAAVAAGRLTEAEGAALKARIGSGDAPLLFGGGHRVGFGHGPDLSTAASYLGLTETQLRTQLESGKTLAEIARDQSKSVDGLVQALVDAKTEKLDAAVAAGRLTEAQKQAILTDLKQRMTELVNGTMPALHGPRGFGGPPVPFVAPAA
jgi:hypothetical protein